MEIFLAPQVVHSSSAFCDMNSRWMQFLGKFSNISLCLWPYHILYAPQTSKRTCAFHLYSFLLTVKHYFHWCNDFNNRFKCLKGYIYPISLWSKPLKLSYLDYVASNVVGLVLWKNLKFSNEYLTLFPARSSSFHVSK